MAMIDLFTIWMSSIGVIVWAVILNQATTKKEGAKAIAWLGVCLGFSLFAAVKVFAP